MTETKMDPVKTILGTSGAGVEAAKASAQTSHTASKPKLKLHDLIDLRGTLRQMTDTKERCDFILADDVERNKWVSFSFEKQKLLIPTDVFLGVLKELRDAMIKEIKAVEVKFEEYGVDPSYAGEVEEDE